MCSEPLILATAHNLDVHISEGVDVGMGQSGIQSLATDYTLYL